jgi:hypothetical protein
MSIITQWCSVCGIDFKQMTFLISCSIVGTRALNPPCSPLSWRSFDPTRTSSVDCASPRTCVPRNDNAVQRSERSCWTRARRSEVGKNAKEERKTRSRGFQGDRGKRWFSVCNLSSIHAIVSHFHDFNRKGFQFYAEFNRTRLKAFFRRPIICCRANG